MPRPKKSSLPLTLSEFDNLASGISELLSRMRATFVAHSSSVDVLDRLKRAGFFVPSNGASKSHASSDDGGAGTARPVRRRRRRNHPPIEAAKIEAAVRGGGTKGRTSGEIAKALGVDIEPLRQKLYVLRDAGTIKMLGKLGGARYVIGGSQAPRPRAQPSTRAKKAAKPVKAAKAQKQAPKKKSTAPDGAAKKAATVKASEPATAATAS